MIKITSRYNVSNVVREGSTLEPLKRFVNIITSVFRYMTYMSHLMHKNTPFTCISTLQKVGYI